MTSFLLDPRRKRSEAAAFDAECAWDEQRRDDARRLFAAAAKDEEEVALEVPHSSARVRGLLAVSAVSLWFKATEFEQAKQLAYTFLAERDLSAQARIELERLVDQCLREGELQYLIDDPGMVPVEVKLDGGRVRRGIAPEAATRKKREALATLLVRVAELEASLPYRERGESDLGRKDEIQLFEVPARAASYGLRFYVATGTQQRFPTTELVTPRRVVERFLELASIAAQGPDAIRQNVDDSQYAQVIVQEFGELAPDGTDVETVACSAPTWKLRSTTTIFELEHRSLLRAGTAVKTVREAGAGEKVIEGALHSVYMTTDGWWIDVKTSRQDEAERVLVIEKSQRAKLLKFVASNKLGDSVRVFARYEKRVKTWALTDVFAI